MSTSAHVARDYYTAMGNKNTKQLSDFLHPEVHFVGPMAEMVGRNRVVDAAQNFMKLFTALEIRHVFEDGENALVVFNLICPDPIGTVRASTLMTIHHGLIVRMELFYDTRPFFAKRDEIFS